MGRASGEPPSPGGGGPPPNPDVARIRQRLARMAPQTKALQLALARYHDDAGSFDLGLWEEAFTSDDPQTINHVVEVTGGYEGLVNHMVEMLRSGAALAGLRIAQRRQGLPVPDLLAAARDDGCFTDGQADVLIGLNRTRNRLQHNSPGVPADEVHERVELLLKTIPRLLRSYVIWMSRHGIQLLPQE